LNVSCKGGPSWNGKRSRKQSSWPRPPYWKSIPRCGPRRLMSQFILDDQLDVRAVLEPLQEWTTAARLGTLRPNEQILDSRIPEILLTLRQPTFVTIDHDFWHRNWCHPGYGILYFALPNEEQSGIPLLLRALLRRPEFRTRAARMG